MDYLALSDDVRYTLLRWYSGFSCFVLDKIYGFIFPDNTAKNQGSMLLNISRWRIFIRNRMVLMTADVRSIFALFGFIAFNSQAKKNND